MSKLNKEMSLHSSRYINRDLSWIEFNRRVLEEAQDESTPLLERTKFLSIVSSNLDEFMSVRVAGVQEQAKAGYTKKDFSGYTPSELLKRLMERTNQMVAEQYKTYRELIRLLNKQEIMFENYKNLNKTQKKEMDKYFHDIVFPVLTPMAVDPSRPFPLVHSQNLYLAVLLKQERDDSEENEPYFAIVQIPSILPRFIEVPYRTRSKKKQFLLLEDLIRVHTKTLFTGYFPIAVNTFRLTRNADLILNEETIDDLLEEVEKELHKRRRGAPVRLEIEQGFHPYSLDILEKELEMQEAGISEIKGPIDLTYFMKFSLSIPGFESLRYPQVDPVYSRDFLESEDFFSVIRQNDVLVYHPYESFSVVSDFISHAAHDKNVLAIKMTLYRVSGESDMIQALADAAEAGKQVTVVVELMARFDEERNIAWARQLEKAGCHVVYGLVGLKTHAKITLVVRKEEQTLMRYVHVGTGNYNDITAKLYTDIGLFTSHPVIGEDASALANEITGYAAPRDWQTFGVAPTDLKDKLFRMIDQEAEQARKGKSTRIIAKMNSLSNQQIIDKLYEASQAGVKIDLIIRGICCLRAGVPGLSENISVRSIVDRFLEHTRIFYFENNKDRNFWISSADWMTRNLFRRIELMCPVFDPKIKETLMKILNLSLNDNVKARELMPDDHYRRVHNDFTPIRSQFEALDITTWKDTDEASSD